MKKTLSPTRLSAFCYELSLVARAGLSLSEGLGLLAAGEKEQDVAAKLSQMADAMTMGSPLSAAMRDTELFPPYAAQMCAIGEQTGRQEQVLAALSVYYARRAAVSQTVRRAAVYPSLLLAVMLLVVILLVTQVMPIFADVFARLGGSMSAAAAAVLQFGVWLELHWVPVFGIAALLGIAVAVCAAVPRVRSAAAAWFFSRRLGKTIAAARFSAVMALAMAGGLSAEESLTMTKSVITDSKMRRAIETCRELCESGKNFGEAIGQSGILRPMDAQMLAIGLRAGHGDTVMEEIARRNEEAVAEETDALLARIEPTIVIIMTVLAAVILLSTMLPLLSIMATL